MKTFEVSLTTATGARLDLPVIARSSCGAALSVLRTLVRPPLRLVAKVMP